MNKDSFTSAATFPTKLLDADLITQAQCHNIKPVHIQLNPTNKCNLKCSFCSCANRDKDQEMPLKKAITIIRTFQHLGTKACTITGGGEPLMHPNINEIITELNDQDIEVGLTTNGHLLDRLDTTLNIKWCRISVSSTRPLSDVAIQAIKTCKRIDWAFSCVIERRKSIKSIIDLVKLANELNVTHVRLVDDILDTNSYMSYVKDMLQTEEIDDSKVIYQARQNYTTGTKRCLISLLKPNIAPDGHLYPCCGIQYARKDYALDFDSVLYDMGDNYQEIWSKQKFFDGSICDKCFYSNYNDILATLWDKLEIKHNKFV